MHTTGFMCVRRPYGTRRDVGAWQDLGVQQTHRECLDPVLKEAREHMPLEQGQETTQSENQQEQSQTWAGPQSIPQWPRSWGSVN